MLVYKKFFYLISNKKMSIIWLDGLINVDEKNNTTLVGGIIFIVINLLSILSSFVFFDTYRKNVQMQKAPCNLIFTLFISMIIFNVLIIDNLLFFKIIFEGLLSLNIFIIFFSYLM